MMKELTSDNFYDTIKNESKPVVVDFWANWCSFCLAIADDYTEIANEYKDQAVFCRFNVDENEELALSFGVNFIPSFIVFENGKVKAKQISETDPKQLKEFVANNI